MKSPMNRRTFLQGAGVTIGLPFLEAMIPMRAHAQMAQPLRAVMMMFPNGVARNSWSPGGTGAAYTLPDNLAALAPYKSRLIFPKNMRQHFGNVDGSGDHARSSGAFLTCAHVIKDSQTARVGVSADQKMASFVAAKAPGLERLLYLGDPASTFADTGSGYSQLYGDHISWREATVPETKLTDPRAVFNKLFSNQTGTTVDAMAEYRRQTRKSILDNVLGQVSSLKTELGAGDKAKMDQYLTALREVEKKISATPPMMGSQCPQVTAPAANLRFDQRMRAMMELAVLAMVCDKTRVVSYILAGEGSGQNFDFIGVSGGHHGISHYPDNANYLAQYQAITKWYGEQLAYLLKRMTDFKEVNGDLLTNSMVAYGAGFHDGNVHDDNNLPIVVAGEAGGRWKSGRALDTGGVPVANLWLTMMRTMGLMDASHGDSTGTINFG